ncbi:MAG: hypothetical protein ACRDV9_14095 [Acidimicrobiia bacterium]
MLTDLAGRVEFPGLGMGPGQEVDRDLLEAIIADDGGEPIEDLVQHPSLTMTRRAILYDTLRMCSSDGPLTDDELECVRGAADNMGVARDVVADLQQMSPTRKPSGIGDTS